MRARTAQRWRGLKALLQDSVEAGSQAVERVHVQTARRPFAVLERVPVVAVPARAVHLVHDAIVTGVYELIRRSNRLIGGTVDLVLDAVERPGSGTTSYRRPPREGQRQGSASREVPPTHTPLASEQQPDQPDGRRQDPQTGIAED